MLNPILQILAGGHAMFDLHFDLYCLMSNMHLNPMLSSNPYLTGGGTCCCLNSIQFAFCSDSTEVSIHIDFQIASTATATQRAKATEMPLGGPSDISRLHKNFKHHKTKGK